MGTTFRCALLGIDWLRRANVVARNSADGRGAALLVKGEGNLACRS
jgi:hypothetical protein